MGLNKQNITQQNSVVEQLQSLKLNDTTVSESRSKRSIFDIGEFIFNLWLHTHALERSLDIGKQYLSEKGKARNAGVYSITSGEPEQRNLNDTTQISTSEKPHAEITRDQQAYLNLELLNAVEQCDLKRVKEYVESGANVNVRNQYGEPLLRIADWYPNSGIREYLIEKGANEEQQVTTHQQVTKLQETTSATMSPEQLDLGLANAVEESDLEKVKEYIKNGANVHARNKYDETPLYVAAYKGYLDIAEYLIENGADVNSDVKYFGKPLLAAVEGRKLNAVELLLNRGADINAGGRHNSAPLIKALRMNEWKVARFLINKGADVNVTHGSGKTPLHYAAKKDRKDIVELLLSREGIDVNAVDNAGRTPLHYAAERGEENIIECLVESGANFNLQDNSSKTPSGLLNQWKANEANRLKANQDYFAKTPFERWKANNGRSSRSIENGETEYNKEKNNQAATSGANKPSSWINVIAHTVVDSVIGSSKFIFKPAISTEQPKFLQHSVAVQGVDSNLLLLNVIARWFTGKKEASYAGALSKEIFTGEKVDDIHPKLIQALKAGKARDWDVDIPSSNLSSTEIQNYGYRSRK